MTVSGEWCAQFKPLGILVLFGSTGFLTVFHCLALKNAYLWEIFFSRRWCTHCDSGYMLPPNLGYQSKQNQWWLQVERHTDRLVLVMETMKASLDIGQKKLLKKEGVSVVLSVDVFSSWLSFRRVVHGKIEGSWVLRWRESWAPDLPWWALIEVT